MVFDPLGLFGGGQSMFGGGNGQNAFGGMGGGFGNALFGAAYGGNNTSPFGQMFGGNSGHPQGSWPAPPGQGNPWGFSVNPPAPPQPSYTPMAQPFPQPPQPAYTPMAQPFPQPAQPQFTPIAQPWLPAPGNIGAQIGAQVGQSIPDAQAAYAQNPFQNGGGMFGPMQPRPQPPRPLVNIHEGGRPQQQNYGWAGGGGTGILGQHYGAHTNQGWVNAPQNKWPGPPPAAAPGGWG